MYQVAEKLPLPPGEDRDEGQRLSQVRGPVSISRTPHPSRRPAHARMLEVGCDDGYIGTGGSSATGALAGSFAIEMLVQP